MQERGETFDRLAMFRIAADKIERDPELLRQSKATLERWLAKGITPRRRLQAWVDRIDHALTNPQDLLELLSRLREDSEDAEFDREFSPFGCLLTTAERRVLIERCAYSH
jgi:hypothetical protein